ncbi:microcompartment protein [Rhodoferax sediminis]|uniref:Microcompartment protein n=1 Tax=Rhodoferax sediminis TaxID=2509614 RepID=A0A515DGD9_9BURK|nr:microcompartment protein [Rhodoferax sediminis]QDL39464.1 microcompartment protein [Rhodoferax sediminis]
MQNELRVYLILERLERQFAAYLSSPTGGRGYVPLEGMSSLILEIAPGLAIERVTDTALKAAPELEPGLLVVERQFGVLEVHADQPADLARAGEAILASLGVRAEDQLKPEILVMDVVEDITDRHAVIINRNKQASMVLPGESVLLLELVPALFASYAANEAEKAVPGIRLIDLRMIGATGRLYLSGSHADVLAAAKHIQAKLAKIPGRASRTEKSR